MVTRGYKATWKREFKLSWCEAGPPNHLDDKVDSDQWVVNKERSLYRLGCRMLRQTGVTYWILRRIGVDSKTFWFVGMCETFVFFFITLKPRVE